MLTNTSTTTVVAVTAAFLLYIVWLLESIFGKLGSLFVMETTGGMLDSLRNGNRRSKDHSYTACKGSSDRQYDGG